MNMAWPSQPVRGRNQSSCHGAWLLLGVAFAGWAVGCSDSSSRLTMPSYSPTDAAHQAIADYDKNGDGVLDARELEKCPPLKNALKDLDRNKDGKLSADEIAAALEDFRASGIVLTTVSCTVKLDNEPLPGATVTLVPEMFLGPAFKPATGVSGASGSIHFKTEGQSLPGVAFGFYRIEVSKKDEAGNETIPAKYNTRTTLGEAIRPGMRGGIVLDLTSS
jgi:EF hand